MLKVIEHKKQAPVRECVYEQLGSRPATGLLHTDRVSDSRSDQIGFCQGGKRDESHPVGEVRSQSLDNTHSKSGLAHSTGAGQCYQARAILLQEANDGGHLVLPADEAGE